MGFKIRKKGKHVKVEKFIKEIQKTYEETILKKSQEEMKKKYTNRNRKKTIEYKVGNRVLLSIKNLMWQIRNRS